MIEIKGQWEQVVTLDDCLRVISYHLGLEFANKVQELVEKKGPDRDKISDAVCMMEESSGDLDRAISDIRRAFKENGWFK